MGSNNFKMALSGTATASGIMSNAEAEMVLCQRGNFICGELESYLSHTL